VDLRGAFCLLITDAQGNVLYQAGLPDEARAGGPQRPAEEGVCWKKALAGLVETSALPECLPRTGCACIVPAPDGQEYRVTFSPLPSGRQGHVILVERRVGAVGADVQRLHALGMVAAGVAHEINNLLTVAAGWLSLLQADEGVAGAHAEPLRKVADAVEQIGRLTVNLLDFARAPAGDRSDVDLNEVVRRILELVDYQLIKNNIEPVLDLAEEPVVARGSEGDLAQALLNLVLNARDAMPDGGRLFISTRREGDRVAVEVRDTGPGVPEEVRDRIFEPFFTTHRSAGGTGLGLAVCKEIVERYGGEIALANHESGGAAFALRLPFATGSVAVAER